MFGRIPSLTPGDNPNLQIVQTKITLVLTEMIMMPVLFELTKPSPLTFLVDVTCCFMGGDTLVVLD